MSLNTKSKTASGALSGKRTERMKPPHSYIALIATAILNSPDKKLTLTEINEYLVKNYAFFRGSYQGWKNSVRHNLSFNKCFVKILRDPARPWGKDNLWAVSDLHDYLLADGSFRRRRRRKQKKDKSIENTGDDSVRKTCHKRHRDHEDGSEEQTLGAKRFPTLQLQANIRNSKTTKETKHTKVSPRKFSGPFSIESILAPNKTTTTKFPSEDRTANSFPAPAVTPHEGSSHTELQVYVTETDSCRPQDNFTLFNSSCQCRGGFMDYRDMYPSYYQPKCYTSFHQVPSCICTQHVKFCY